jgi:hypothetical protein
MVGHFVLACLLNLNKHMHAHPFNQKKLPCQDFLPLVCQFLALEGLQFQQFGGSSEILYSVWEEGTPALPQGDDSCCLVPAAPRFG